MTPCPNYHPTGGGKSFRCAVLPGVILPSLGAARNPCGDCQSQWTDNQPPTAATLPPVLVQIAGRHGAKTETIVHVRPDTSRRGTRRHPEECHYSLRVLDHVGCCGSRRWQCEIHGEVRLNDCRRCAEFERDSPENPKS